MNKWIQWMQAAWKRHRQHRRTQEVYEALMDLDGRTLRDLGFDRSEAMSVACEITAQVDRTRVNTRPPAAEGPGPGPYCSAAGCATR